MKRVWVAFLALTLVAVLAGGALAQQSLTWTAGSVGGGWYAISGGMAELLREKAGLNIKVVPGGGTQNPVLVEKGEAELGMGLPPLLGAALRGEDPYPGQKMAALRALAGNMSLNTFHFYVAADSPFAKMTMDEIFRGKKRIRLAISKPGSSDVWVFEKVMEFYGYCAPGKTPDCYKTWEAAGTKFFRGSYSEQAGAFKDRNVDGTFTFLALPGASITEASVGRELKLLAFPKPLLQYLGKFGLGEGVIPPGTYPKAANASEPVVSATMGTTITVNSKMSNDLAYTITKALNDNVDRVRKIHGSLADYDPAKGHLFLGVALHPGAERYYREKGYLK
ncbi:MAG TPA: TAXI family TRAP transporter solute-binding subunit [Methylomirabilota bacterium]|jgi:TRAP transporter TAXI family solute receptor|nr:TAXI family TRAP transporter solute-binding subunit [Methylomirabilota bacterium]